jgi:hypothetical protein
MHSNFQLESDVPFYFVALDKTVNQDFTLMLKGLNAITKIALLSK